jgi:aspartyl-tRNA(Asn)/glutamyl-tRNA(Gln) amidotransferase subunit A
MARYDGIEFGLRAAENRSTEELYASTRSQGFNEIVRGRILAGNYFLLQRYYLLTHSLSLTLTHSMMQDILLKVDSYSAC